MFFFGSPLDTVALYMEEAKAVTGPECSELHPDEMTVKEVQIYAIYVRIAFRRASEDGAPEDVLNTIRYYYDILYTYLAEHSEDFRTAVRTGKHRMLEYNQNAHLKYKHLFYEGSGERLPSNW